MKDADGNDLELTPFGRHLVATLGCIMFAVGAWLIVRAATIPGSPFPIWEILLAVTGTITIIASDPVS